MGAHMIAILELEVFASVAGSQRRMPLQGNAPWVAQITGLNRNGYFVREFQKGEVDYSQSNSIGSRGAHRYYHLKSGCIYEVAKRCTWNRTVQYFCRVTEEGEIVEVTRKQVLDLFQGARTAQVPALSRGIHDD